MKRNPWRHIEKGAGAIDGDNYRPAIQTRDFSSRGRKHRRKSNKCDGLSHLVSDVERAVFVFAELDPRIIEIRDQVAHTPLDHSIALACDLGIKHPRAQGKLFPVTTDFLFTFEDGRRLAVEAKDRAESEMSLRDQDISLLKRCWWQAKDIEYLHVSAQSLNRTVVANVRWLTYGIKDVEIATEALEAFAGDFSSLYVPDVSLNDLLSRCPERGVDRLWIFRRAVVDGLIRINLRKPVLLLSSPQLLSAGEEPLDWPW